MKYQYTATSTWASSKYEDWFTDEIMEFVRDVKDENDALHNLAVIMATYEKGKTFRQKLAALFL